MHANTRIFILQLCYLGLALSQYPPKYPVQPNPNDFCARFNGIKRGDIPLSSVDAMFDTFHRRCYDCCPSTGEYVRTELRCNGEEDCSTGSDERYCEPKSLFKQFSKAFSSQSCLSGEKDCSHHYLCCAGYCKKGRCLY